MTEYFDFQNLFSLSVIGGGVRAGGGEEEVESNPPRDGDVSPLMDVPIFRLRRCTNFY